MPVAGRNGVAATEDTAVAAARGTAAVAAGCTAVVAGGTSLDPEFEAASGWSCWLHSVPCIRSPGIATGTQLVAWCSSTARGPAATARRTWERTRRWVQNRVDGFLVARRMAARFVYVLPRRYPAWQPPGSG